MRDKQSVLILCVGNSCRSQMAEGLLRHYAADRFAVYSAGLEPAERVHPLATAVMEELGIDISSQRPKAVKQYLARLTAHYVVSVCELDDRNCPRMFPGTTRWLSWPFDDVGALRGPESELVPEFRRVRDEIKQRIQDWLDTLP